jgi:hypothetical protein
VEIDAAFRAAYVALGSTSVSGIGAAIGDGQQIDLILDVDQTYAVQELQFTPPIYQTFDDALDSPRGGRSLTSVLANESDENRLLREQVILLIAFRVTGIGE